MKKTLSAVLQSYGLAIPSGTDAKKYLLRNRFILLGVMVFFAPITVGLVQDSLFDADCEVRDLAAFVASASGSPLPPSCRSVPLAIDVTSIVIWIACWGSVLIFSRLTRQLEKLDEDLSTSKLVIGADSVMTFPLQKRDEWTRPSGRALLLLISSSAGLVAVGVEFHQFVRDSSPYFEFLADASGQHSAQEFGSSWWAASGLGAWVWIAVGVVGAHFAVRHMWINLVFTTGLRRRPLIISTRYRENWEDPDHGWAAFESILLTIAIGIFNFALAFVAIIYLLLARSPQVELTLVVLAAASAGVFANYWASVSVVRFIRDSFGQARVRYARRLRSKTVPSISPGEAVIIAEKIRMLNDVGGFPLRGFWRHAVPFAIALTGQLALIAAIARWLLTS